jgi:hypothetical protein
VQDFQQLLQLEQVSLVRKDGRTASVETFESFVQNNGYEPRYFPDFQALAGALEWHKPLELHVPSCSKANRERNFAAARVVLLTMCTIYVQGTHPTILLVCAALERSEQMSSSGSMPHWRTSSPMLRTWCDAIARLLTHQYMALTSLVAAIAMCR